MSPLNFSALARDLLGDTLENVAMLDAGSVGLIGLDDEPGALDLACACLKAGDLPQTLQHLVVAETLCRVPVEPPATGRNRLERHMQATRTRARLLRTAQIARVLVLDAIKTEGGAA